MTQEGRSKFPDTFRNVLIVALRVVLVAALFGAGWFVYRELPATSSATSANLTATSLQIVMSKPENDGPALAEVQVNLFPIDVVAVRHEYFAEPRAGKRLEDFLKERMKGRSPVSTRLDQEGQATVTLSQGNWWLHAILPGDEQLEWRLPLTVRGAKQTIELTPQNAYTKSRTF